MNSTLIDRPAVPERGEPLPSAVALAACPSLALWWQLARAYHAVHLRVGQFFDERGMTGAQYGVLRCLGEAGPDGLMLTALSERLLVTCGNITGVVDRLEQSGLLRRERSLEDRRVIIARLTPRGQALYREVVPEFREYLAGLLAGIETEDQWELARLCEQVRLQVTSVASEVG
jgi:DNA-binding MarR family transcriptional regulator